MFPRAVPVLCVSDAAVCGVVVLVMGRAPDYIPMSGPETGRARAACVPCCAGVSITGWPAISAFYDRLSTF